MLSLLSLYCYAPGFFIMFVIMGVIFAGFFGELVKSLKGASIYPKLFCLTLFSLIGLLISFIVA